MSAFGIKPCIEEALQQFLKANEGETDCMPDLYANNLCMDMHMLQPYIHISLHSHHGLIN